MLETGIAAVAVAAVAPPPLSGEAAAVGARGGARRGQVTALLNLYRRAAVLAHLVFVPTPQLTAQVQALLQTATASGASGSSGSSSNVPPVVKTIGIHM